MKISSVAPNPININNRISQQSPQSAQNTLATTHDKADYFYDIQVKYFGRALNNKDEVTLTRAHLYNIYHEAYEVGRLTESSPVYQEY